MKKIVLSLSLAIVSVSANWLPSVFNNKETQKEQKILRATPFLQIEQKISKEPMMLEFGATSCHSCVEMGKILYKIKQKYPNSNIYFVDVYEDKEAAMKFKIRMIPTQKYLNKEGQTVDTHVGMIKQAELEKKLKSLGII